MAHDILIIDDEPDIRLLIEATIFDYDEAVIGVGGVEEGD